MLLSSLTQELFLLAQTILVIPAFQRRVDKKTVYGNSAKLKVWLMILLNTIGDFSPKKKYHNDFNSLSYHHIRLLPQHLFGVFHEMHF